MPKGTIWPGRDEADLLGAGLLPPEAAAAAWARWRQSIDLDDVPNQSTRLIPLAFRNLEGVDLGDEDIGRIRGIYRKSWVRNQLLVGLTAPAIAELERSGISTLVTKGVAVGLGERRDPGVRWAADLDLLVAPSDADRAHAVLNSLGWRDHQGLPSQLMSTRHGSAYENEDGRMIDLHWRAFWLPAPDDDLWADARPLDVGGVATRIPSRADMLLHACVHGANWAPTGQLDWIADAHALVAASEPAEWEALIEKADRRRIHMFVRPVLAYLAGRFGSEIPDEVLRALNSAPVGAQERLAYAALMRSSRVGGHLPIAWDVYRRHRQLGVEGPSSPSFLAFLRSHFGYGNTRELIAGAGRLALRSTRARVSGRSAA